MKKWVIKQPCKGVCLEVWEYIDSVDEAMEYWYIAQAIRKYGVDQVVPLAMNDVGGYHHLPKDSKEIIKIIESEDKPTIPVFYKYVISPEVSYNGWLAPDGTIYECGAYNHISAAIDICDYYKINCYLFTPDDKLLKLGWVKIVNRQYIGNDFKLTKEQIARIEAQGLKDYAKIYS